MCSGVLVLGSETEFDPAVVAMIVTIAKAMHGHEQRLEEAMLTGDSAAVEEVRQAMSADAENDLRALVESWGEELGSFHLVFTNDDEVDDGSFVASVDPDFGDEPA